MEYLKGGPLSEVIERTYSSGKCIKPINSSKIVKAILEAVAYIHSYDAAHRDLKPGYFIINIRKYNVWECE